MSEFEYQTCLSDFRQQDELAKAEIRAKLEKILAMDDKDSKKQEIVEILGDLLLSIFIFLNKYM